MSRLTDYQMKSMISRCRSAAELYGRDGQEKRAARSRATAEKYEVELAARERGEAVQEPREVRFGKT